MEAHVRYIKLCVRSYCNMVDDFLYRVSSFFKMCIEPHCNTQFPKNPQSVSQKHHKIGFASGVGLIISKEGILASNVQLLGMSQKQEKREAMKFAPTQPTLFFSVVLMS